ncbi:MAG: hypothetical protein KAJ60_00300 [Desulfobulbaceae bacterium]|nr:hypothetical protein [Desulfobulbaceae bacterium]
MMNEEREFVEGFLAAARIYGRAGKEAAIVSEKEGGMRGGKSTRRFRIYGRQLSYDEYLEVPTYIRRGKAKGLQKNKFTF